MDQSSVDNLGPAQGQNIGQSQQITQHFYPPVPAPLSQKPERVTLDQQNRERMLRRFRRALSDLMSQTLQGPVVVQPLRECLVLVVMRLFNLQPNTL
jgi:hypothetical protein